MEKENAADLHGNDKYEGFCIDLIKEISDILGFNYTLRPVKDGNYGSVNKETGEWNGMIKELLDRVSNERRTKHKSPTKSPIYYIGFIMKRVCHRKQT
jgi:hypothetical protein